MTVRTGLSLALAALPTVMGCDSGDIPFSDFQSQILTAACRYEVLCRDYPDQATCLASTQTQPHLFDTLSVDIASRKVIYDGVSARACVDVINGLSACTRDALSMLNSRTAVCNKVFTGTIAVGGNCFFSEECTSGGSCLNTGNCTSSSQCCAGTCQAPIPTVGAGGDCSNGTSICAVGTTCVANPTSGARTCQAPVTAGGSCANSTTCAAGLYCDLTTTQTCKPLVPTGDTCNPALGSQDCSGAQDLCDSTTSLCTPPLAVGSPCAGSSQTCVSYATCDATSGTCIERPVMGASCDPTNGPTCLGGNCDATTMTCRLPVTTGACS